MSRARNIKPGFFKNETLVELPFEYRLLFIGLWTLADREGRLEDRPKRIRMEIFPGDSVDINVGLEALQQAQLIVRYTSAGVSYIAIPTWAKHQNPHHREALSTIPAPDKPGASPGQALNQPECSRADSLIPDSLIPKDYHPSGGCRNSRTSSDPAPPTDADDEATDAASPRCPVSEIVALYHATLPQLPRVVKLTAARSAAIRQRWREDLGTLDDWRSYFADVQTAPFLMGKIQGRGGRTPFRASLPWLVKAENFAKVAEGKYHEGRP